MQALNIWSKKKKYSTTESSVGEAYRSGSGYVYLLEEYLYRMKLHHEDVRGVIAPIYFKERVEFDKACILPFWNLIFLVQKGRNIIASLAK